MRKEAFGEIGILPDDFYKMRFVDYLLLQEGFRNKRKWDQRLIRKAVAKILGPYAKEGSSIDEFKLWPVDGDDVLIQEHKEYRKNRSIEVSERNMEVLRQFKEREKREN